MCTICSPPHRTTSNICRKSFRILKKFNDPSTKAAFLGGFNSVLYANKVNLYGFPLTICNQPFMQRQYGIVFPKGSFLLPTFDEKILYAVENGLINHWISKETRATIKHPQNHHELMKLTMNHLLGSYQLMLFGASLASAVFIVELLTLRVEALRKFFGFFS
jgi:hypothetical protein